MEIDARFVSLVTAASTGNFHRGTKRCEIDAFGKRLLVYFHAHAYWLAPLPPTFSLLGLFCAHFLICSLPSKTY